MKILRMRPEYIEWTRAGKKIATTRTEDKVGEKQLCFELVSGSRYKPKKSGVVIRVLSCLRWNQERLAQPENRWVRNFITLAEGFKSWEDFMAIIRKINKGKRITSQTWFYTHFYGVVDDEKRVEAR
jgi:hypothetical protein